jgi:acyl-[acyl-carrier-protein]-phospholipid O-acyltransferase / long-chain-fatty-acid--[acyl-carrier-protein] ligase
MLAQGMLKRVAVMKTAMKSITSPADANARAGIRSLPWLLTAQTQVVFNDNAAKLALIGLIQFPGIVTGDRALVLISLIAALLVLPFVLLAPLAGWVADRFPKRGLLNALLVAQVGAVAWIAAALLLQNLTAAVIGFALLAVQSCFFSPAKQAILKELVGEQRLGVAVGWMEMLGTAAILSGSVAGAWMFDRFTPALGGDAPTAALLTIVLLAGAAVVSLLVLQPVQKTTAHTRSKFQIQILWDHFNQLSHLWKDRSLRLAALGNAYVYALGGVLYLTLIQCGREVHGGGTGSVSETGLLFLMLGAGVAAGSFAAAGICRRRIELGLIPVGALALAGALIGVALAETSTARALGLFAVGLAAGLFVVPVNAFLQAKAPDAQRGRIIAASNLLTNLAGVGAVGFQFLLAHQLGLGAREQFLILTIPAIAVALYILRLLPEGFISLAARMVARLLYRPQVRGLENIPAGGALLVCNHVSYLDALLIQTICPRPVRFVAFSGLQQVGWVRLMFRLFQAIPIDARQARTGIRSAVTHLQQGELVCIFPEGALTRTGSHQAIRKGFTLIARQAGVPVVPVHIDGLWGSLFTFSGNRFFRKLPRRRRHPLTVRVGPPLTATRATPDSVLENLLLLANESFEQRPQLHRHLGRECIHSLTRSRWKTAIVDHYPARKILARGTLLGLALLLARRWKAGISGPRVGIALPPGIGGTLANLACVCAGKTPVNLNITAGRAAIEAALRQGDIETVITAEAIINRCKDFPWPADTRDIQTEFASGSKARTLLHLAAGWILPARAIFAWLQIPREGGHRECALLFTSGSSGEPKGVVLSHRNILGNILQMAETNFLQPHDRVMGCLPLFHSFGFTVTLWTPILQGLPLITYPSPLDPRKVAEAIHRDQATILAGTATFLRPYLKKVEAEKLSSLRMVVAGAEKVPVELAAAFQEKFSLPILEGYGLTETTPCLSVNMPDSLGPQLKAAEQSTRGAGTVGRLLPGIAVRIVHPETGKPLPLSEPGLLQVRGPNVFAGYLDRPDLTGQVLQNGWFNTGDIVRFDEEGFLRIEGRLSRFSKIAGEMVPHALLEEKIIDALGLAGADHQPIAITAIADEEKGEALVLVAAVPVLERDLRQALAAAGVPNLWIPRQIVATESIPVLASGKLDLKACRMLAEDSLRATAAA